MRRSIACFLLLALAASAPAAHAETAHVFEEGLASWYGGKFHGRQTASGEIYDKDDLTAAHRTLPFGTVLLITNLDNGRTCRVRVTDRGPFVHGRILDCSEGAAEELGYRAAGLARVRLEILGRLPEAESRGLSKRERKNLQVKLRHAARQTRRVDDDGPPAAAQPAAAQPAAVAPARGSVVLLPVDLEAGPFAVQVGAFAQHENARRLAGDLAALGLTSRLVELHQDGLLRVQVGPHATRSAAEGAAARLEDLGHPGFLTRADSP